MNILNDFAIALVQPSRYKELLKNSVGRVILYIIILLLISAISIVANMRKVTNMLGEYFENNIPEFTFENNILKSEDVFDLDFAGTKIEINTEKQLTEAELEKAYVGILFDSDSMLLKQAGKVQEVKYKDVTEGKDIKLTKDSLYDYKDIAKMIFNIYTAILILLSIPLFLLGALITALLGKLFTSFLPTNSMDINFGRIYKLALYSRALPTILSLILSIFIGQITPIISVMLSVMILTRAIAHTVSSENV